MRNLQERLIMAYGYYLEAEGTVRYVLVIMIY